MKDPYAVLGVTRAASEAEIKAAYRKLAKQLHPDRNVSNPKAVERFKDVSAAYEIVGDAEKRGKFDRGEINAQGQPQAGDFGDFARRARPNRAGARPGGFEPGGQSWSGNPEDLFSDLFSSGRGPSGFGGGRRPAPKGGDVEYELPVDFADAALAKPQRLTLVTGKTLEIRLPPGVTDGQQIRLAGQGMTGPGGAGDAIVAVRLLSHPLFRREGDDILLDLPVALDEAVLGAKIKTPTLDGAVLVTVPANSSSGRLLRLKGKGFTTKAGGRGDQLVRLMIDLPRDDAALKAFAESWGPKQSHKPRQALGLD